MSKPPKSEAEKLVENKLEDFSSDETSNLISDFEKHFEKCVSACKKPNILVTGVTGSGKSTLINAVFGENVAQSGVGLPITQHFSRFEPENKPVIIYDSKGLEWNEHEKFIKETTKFFNSLRAKKDVEDHIHCIWYVINAGRGRIDPFEIKLLKEVLAPTPVIFILNKADLADAKQLKSLKDVLKKEDISSCKGIFVSVSKRQTFTQGWCPSCYEDDIFFDEETKELECVSCDYKCIITEKFGLEPIVKRTTELLPEFAKDAFMYAQEISQKQKDLRAKEVAKKIIKKISLDVKGNFFNKVAELFAKLFVIWGYPLTGSKFKDEINSIQKEYVSQMKLQERIFISSLDSIFQKKISRGFTAIMGMTMNKGMKVLNEKLIEHTKNGTLGELDVSNFLKDADLDEDVLMLFFETALFEGIEKAIDMYWSVDKEQLEELTKKSQLLGDNGEFHDKGGFDPYNEVDQEILYQIFQKIQEEEKNKNGDNNTKNSKGNRDPKELETDIFDKLMKDREEGVKIEFLDEEDEKKKDVKDNSEEKKKDDDSKKGPDPNVDLEEPEID